PGVRAVSRRTGSGRGRRRGRPWRVRGSAGGGGVCARTEPTGEPVRPRRLQEAQREGTRTAVSADPPVRAGLSRGVHPVGRGGSAGGARGEYRGEAGRGGGACGSARCL